MRLWYTAFIMLLFHFQAEAGISDFDVMDFGAKPDGVFDNTSAFQNALDEAGKTGGVVHIPCRQFRVNGTLTIPTGVALEGMARGPHMPVNDKVTMLLAFAGRDNENSEPFICLETNATIKGLSIFYPEQHVSDIRPYPWTIAVRGSRTNIIDVTCANSYNGIDCGSFANHSHHLRNVSMTALRRGVYIDRTSDIGRIENVHIHAVNWWSMSEPYTLTREELDTLKQYTMKNLEGFIIGRCDWEYMTNCFAIWMKTGFRFIHTPLKEGERTKGIDEANILITQSGSDMSPLAVVIEKLQDHAGIAFENCQFMNGIEVQEENTGPLKFTNCGFWGETLTGKLKGTIIQNRGSGQIFLNSCHFSTWEDPNRTGIVWNPDTPLIDLQNGSLIITGCVFKDYGVDFKTHILIRNDAEAAVINGNIVQGGTLKVENTSKADVQTFGNVHTR